MAEFIPTGLGGLGSRTVGRRRSTQTGSRSFDRQELYPPPRPPRNFIPSQEIMEALIERALNALARGMYWDRGSIVNIVL